MTAASQAAAGLASRAHMVESTREILHLLPPSREAGIGHEVLVGRKGALLVPARGAQVASVSVHEPALGLVVQIRHHDLIQHLLVDRGVLYRSQNLDATIEVARHPVGRGDEHASVIGGQGVAVRKDAYPRVLQETADDAFYPDVV